MILSGRRCSNGSVDVLDNHHMQSTAQTRSTFGSTIYPARPDCKSYGHDKADIMGGAERVWVEQRNRLRAVTAVRDERGPRRGSGLLRERKRGISSVLARSASVARTSHSQATSPLRRGARYARELSCVVSAFHGQPADHERRLGVMWA